MRGDGHEVSILIRVGDGDCAGRAPSNVSMMITDRSNKGTGGRSEVFRSRCRPRRARSRAGAGRGEQLANALDAVRSNRAGEEAVMADAVEAARQDVQEKAGDELGGVERHGLEPVAAFDPVVFPFEGDAPVVERDEPGVGDGDAVGVVREIGEHRFRSGEGALGVDDPLGPRDRPRPAPKGRARRATRSPGRPGGRPVERREPFEKEAAGRDATARARAGRSRAGRRSSAPRPATGRRRAR